MTLYCFPSFSLLILTVKFTKPRFSSFLNIINNKITSSKVKTQCDQDNRSRTRQLNSNQVNTYNPYNRTHKTWLPLPSLNLTKQAVSQSTLDPLPFGLHRQPFSQLPHNTISPVEITSLRYNRVTLSTRLREIVFQPAINRYKMSYSQPLFSL